MSKKPDWILNVSIFGLCLTVCLWGIAEFIAERTWFTTLFTYAPPLLLALPTTFVLLLTLIFRDVRALLVNLVASLFVLFVSLGLSLPHAPKLPSSTPHFRLMTYNIEHGAKGIDNLVQQVRQQNPDMLCVQECNAYHPYENPYPHLRQALPEYQFTDANETVIATRLPLLHKKLTPLLQSGSRSIVRVDTSVQGRPVTILSLHLMTAATPESLSSHRGSIPAYLHRTTTIRAEQLDQVIAEVKEITTPIVMCGDFNTPPRGLFYQRLTRYFTDAFATQGFGFGWTYPSRIPCLRIDYILTRQGATPIKAFVPKTKASDHRPLVADIALTNTNEEAK